MEDEKLTLTELHAFTPTKYLVPIACENGTYVLQGTRDNCRAFKTC